MASSSKRNEAHTPSPTKKKSYALVLATPNKADRLTRLQVALNHVQEENRELKTRLCALEIRLSELEVMAKSKAVEVKDAISTISSMATSAQVQEVTSSLTHKVQACVTANFRERRLQEENALKIRIGGLPTEWDSRNIDFEDEVMALNEALHPAHVDRDALEAISNKRNHSKEDRIANGQAILILAKPEDRLRLLQQSRLLKGTTMWIAEELTPTQLKHKAQELKKMHAARREGKWAVLRNGRAVIQEFRTPKPATPPLSDTPPTP